MHLIKNIIAQKYRKNKKIIHDHKLQENHKNVMAMSKQKILIS